jgi:hypothetical protein
LAFVLKGTTTVAAFFEKCALVVGGAVEKPHTGFSYVDEFILECIHEPGANSQATSSVNIHFSWCL